MFNLINSTFLFYIKNLIVFIICLAVFVFPIEANALSCAQTVPKIGLVDSITSNGEIKLKNLSTFDQSQFANDGVYDLNIFENIVITYIESDYSLETIPEGVFQPNTIDLSNTEVLDIQKGEIIIQGPPFHVCDYSTIAVFNSGAQLQKALMQGGFEDFIYKSSKLSVSPGDNIKCNNETKICDVGVNFSVGNTGDVIKPGESVFFNHGSFKKVDLISATYPTDPQFDVWGMGTSAEYVVYFQDVNENISAASGATAGDEHSMFGLLVAFFSTFINKITSIFF